jgi:transcriptional regulator with XRE-family HTH domain
VYTLELRGLSYKQIAEALNMSSSGVAHIVADPRYIEYREQHLATLDQEFVAMKPLAFRALRGGLQSPDENTALRASEQWFKAANYGGFSKHERPAVSTSAEDIARELLRGGINVQVNTQVNVAPPESSDS